MILAGGSGFLGQHLARYFKVRQYQPVILTRTPQSRTDGIREVAWDGQSLGAWTDELEGAEVIINLAGKNVSCRYTPENRKEINESRTRSVEVVAEALNRCGNKPAVWIQAGSSAIYGDSGDRFCDESSPVGEGFPVETCLLWEKSWKEAEVPGVRKVYLRIGFVLGADGGVLSLLKRLALCFLGGTTGHGRQYISWIHMEDMLELTGWIIGRSDLEGIFNANAPEPVTNREFMRLLRAALSRPWSPPAPAWAVRIGTWVLRTEAILALTGRRVEPRRLLESGFRFRYEKLPEAFSDLFNRSGKKQQGEAI
jgi:uncharacterized protein (TIGR01777 family)